MLTITSLRILNFRALGSYMYYIKECKNLGFKTRSSWVEG